MDPFIGQLTLGAWPITPRGFQQCNGQILPINQWQAVFALLGVQFGGNGVNTFGLPDLRGRTPMGASSQYPIGAIAGEEMHTLTMNEVPSHQHNLMAGGAADGPRPGASTTLGGGGITAYTPLANPVALDASAVGNNGGGQPHENRQPYLVMNWIICLNGIFPSRS